MTERREYTRLGDWHDQLEWLQATRVAVQREIAVMTTTTLTMIWMVQTDGFITLLSIMATSVATRKGRMTPSLHSHQANHLMAVTKTILLMEVHVCQVCSI